MATKSEFPEAWFADAILDGLSQLISLSLEGTPALELAPITAQTWAKALWRQPVGWNRDEDLWRLESAFTALPMRLEKNRFPSPKELYLALPERKQHPKIEHQISDEERAANSKKLKAMLNDALYKMAA